MPNRPRSGRSRLAAFGLFLLLLLRSSADAGAAAGIPATYADLVQRVVVLNYPNGFRGSFRILAGNSYEASPSEGFSTKTAAYTTGGLPDGQALLTLASSQVTGGVNYRQTNSITLTFTSPAGGTYRKEFVISTQAGSQFQEGTFELSSGNNVAPQVALQPQSATLPPGNSYTLRVVPIGFGNSFQWLRDGQPIAGATASSLDLGPLSPAVTGSYTVVISNSAGSVTSDPAGVAITAPPAITRQPASVSIFEGSPFRLEVEATGTELQYAWTVNGRPVDNPNSPSLVVGSATAAQAGTYRVRISNNAGTLDSEPATVAVCATQTNHLYRGRPWVRIALSGDPVPGHPNTLGTLRAPFLPQFTLRDRTVHLALRGDNDAPDTAAVHRALLRWRDGSLSTLVFTNTPRPGGGTFDDVFYLTDEEDGAVNFGSGAMYELRNGVITPLVGPDTQAPGRAEKLGGPGSFARRGPRVAIAAAIAGNGPGTVTGAGIYLHDGTALSRICDDTTDLPGVMPGYGFRPTEDAINFDGSTIVFSTVAGLNGAGGVFRATTAGQVTKLLDTGDLLPGLGNAVIGFGDVDVEGGSVFAIVGVNAAAPPRVSLLNRAVAFAPDGSARILGNADYLVAGGPDLAWFGTASVISRWSDGALSQVINTAAVLDCKRVSRFFDVEAHGDDIAIGVEFQDGSVGVYANFGEPGTGAPRILAPPVDTRAPATTPVTFAIAAVGAEPLAYAWRHNGIPIPGATAPTLLIPVAQAGDAGAYEVTVSNAAGSATAAPAALTVADPPAKPLIFAQPATVTVPIGSPGSLRVVAAGAPPLTYQWRQGTNPVAGATGPSLQVLLPTNATFNVVIANAGGSITSSLATVSVAPIITRQPEPRQAQAGGTATFSVEATGFESLRYFWFRDTTLLTGQTNATLVLENVQPADAGAYSVQVFGNGGGALRSSAAQLTVGGGGGGTPSPVTLAAPVLVEGLLRFEFTTAAGRSYEVQFREVLGTGPWSTTRTLSGDGSRLSVTVPVPGGSGFYRIATKP